MDLIKTKKVDFSFEDERGSLTQLVHDGFDQVNVLITKKNVIRGGHYHKKSVEAFYIISGKVEVTAKYEKKVRKYNFQKGDFFEVHPYVLHSMFFEEDCIMVQMYDPCVELPDGTKDIYTE